MTYDVSRSFVYARPEDLLDGYRNDTPFFFSTPEHTLLAQGEFSRVRATGDDTLSGLADAVDQALAEARRAGHPNPVVVGAIPFDPAQAACLCIPHHLLCAGRLPADRSPAAPIAPALQITPDPAPACYMDAVQRAVLKMQAGELDKVVLARTLWLQAGETIDTPALLARLAAHNPHGYTFAVDLSAQDKGCLLGASPELLLSRRGDQVRSNPLAGSAARAHDEAEDQRRARALQSSAKDLAEHAFVADAVARQLRPFCQTLDAPTAPSLIHTETMWHLSSDIRGLLRHDAPNSLRLAAALHPTPAVCGHPTASARALIRELEPFDRGFYTGMVGWCDSSGNGEWIVTIRCAQVQDRALRLFAGAGTVAASSPELELAETSAKFRTLLHALGLDPQEAV